MAASHCSSGKSSHALSAPSSATFRLFLLRRVFWSIRSGGISVPPGRSCQRLFSTWLGASTTRKSASPGGTIGLKTSAPKRISLVTEPPRWLMPWISLFFTSRPQRKAAAATMSDAFNAPWPPSPAMTTFTTLFGALFGEGKARLLFERLFVSQAWQPRGVDGGIHPHRPRHAERFHQVFENHFSGAPAIERTARSGVLLHAGHGGGAVVENDGQVAARRRIVDRFHQARDAGVQERAVADDAHHAPRFLAWQHVPQAQADGDASAHAHAGIERVERRQPAQRVAADVARHNAAQVAQRGKHGAVRTAGAQLRRLARRQTDRNGAR